MSGCHWTRRDAGRRTYPVTATIRSASPSRIYPSCVVRNRGSVIWPIGPATPRSGRYARPHPEEYVQALPCGEIVDLSGELDGLIVGLDRVQLERVIAGKLFGWIRANGHCPSLLTIGRPSRKMMRPMSFSAWRISSMARFSRTSGACHSPSWRTFQSAPCTG